MLWNNEIGPGSQPASTKRLLAEQFARVGKAVGNPARLELLDLLAQGEKTVELLARQAGLSVTNASNHLKELRLSGLVATRREGPYVHYRLADPAVHDFVRTLQRLAQQRLAEVQQLVRDTFERSADLKPVSAAELLERSRADEVLVLDVRPEDEYAAGHVAGAMSMPLEQLEHRLSSLPSDREIVAYCRGPYCVYAVQAVELLRARGYSARRVEEGVAELRTSGFEIEGGET